MIVTFGSVPHQHARESKLGTSMKSGSRFFNLSTLPSSMTL